MRKVRPEPHSWQVAKLEFKSKQSNFTTPVYNLYSKEPSSEVKQKEGES